MSNLPSLREGDYWYFIMRSRLELRACLLCFAINAVSFSPSASGATDNQIVRLHGRNFEIPRRYLQDGGQVAPSWLRWLPGLDDSSRELLLTISASEVAAAVPNFKPKNGRYNDDLRLRLVVLKEDERRGYLDPNRLADIWNSTGSYRNRVIETDVETHFVRAYRRVEYPNSWQVLTITPDKPMAPDLFSIWVGHCLNSHSPLTPSGTLALCKSYVVVNDIAVNFTMSAQNLVNIDAIRSYLASLALHWLK